MKSIVDRERWLCWKGLFIISLRSTIHSLLMIVPLFRTAALRLICNCVYVEGERKLLMLILQVCVSNGK